jgi:paraquat-inducible protein A
MNLSTIAACHECDLIHRLGTVPAGKMAKCSRCGAVLVHAKSNNDERTLALAVTGLILFVIANVFPFLSFSLEGQVRQTTLLSGVMGLYDQDLWAVSGLVLLTTFLVPLAQIMGLLYIFIPLNFGKPAVYSPAVFRMIEKLRPWSMLEIFMLGTLVSIVKLSDSATIITGVSLYALLILIFVLTAVMTGIDSHHFWQNWVYQR